jgi:hypothetical protein
MTGPAHYTEGERLLERCADLAEGSAQRTGLATEAVAHLLAALTAAVATHAHPDSTSWDHAIYPQET